MVKRKLDTDLVRFVWKRNKQYDVMLLTEVESRNPFGFKKSGPVWKGIAEELQECSLKMKVSERSCRERTIDLLSDYRRKERQSKASSGIAEPEMTELDRLLTSVAKLQEGGPSREVRVVYERQDKSEVDAIRAAAVAPINLADDSGDEFRDEFYIEDLDITDALSDSGASGEGSETNPIIATTPVTDVDNSDAVNEVTFDQNVSSIPNTSASASMVNETTSIRNTDTTSVTTSNRNSSSVPSTSARGSKRVRVDRLAEENASLQIFFNDHEELEQMEHGHQDHSEKLNKSGGNSQKPNPKQSLVRYLEKKSEGELDVRKQEIDLRRDELKMKENEVAQGIDIRRDELKMKENEVAQGIDIRREELKMKENEVAQGIDLRRCELKIKEMEVELKNKELEIQLEKTKGETDNQKRITDLLFMLVSRNQNQN